MRICKLDKTEQIWGRGGPSAATTLSSASYMGAAGGASAIGAAVAAGGISFTPSTPSGNAQTFNPSFTFVPNLQLNQFYGDAANAVCNVAVATVVGVVAAPATVLGNAGAGALGFGAGTFFCPSSSSSSSSSSPSSSSSSSSSPSSSYSSSPSPSCNPSTSCCSSSSSSSD
jgi:hypothetical protein